MQRISEKTIAQDEADGFLRNSLHFLYFANLVWILGSIPTVGKIPSPLIRVNYLDKINGELQGENNEDQCTKG